MKKQNLISAFDALLGPPIVEEIPKGFYNAQDLAKHKGITERQMHYMLRDLTKAQKIDRRQFRNSNGRVCWFYRVR